MDIQKQDLPISQGEISLIEIINFLRVVWKKLAIAALFGAIFGFAIWFFSNSYSAEQILLNNGDADLVEFRTLQKNLPILVSQIIAEGKVPLGQESLYRSLSSADWWLKNVVPGFYLNKSEAKDPPQINNLQLAANSVRSITITASGRSNDMATDTVLLAKNFFLSGAVYLSIRSMFRNQESQAMIADAEIAKKINTTQNELDYQLKRLKDLESLAKRLPSEAKVTVVNDSGNSQLKYLPISSHIIAVNTDIYNLNESLERLKDKQAQVKVLKDWINQVQPLVKSIYDGIALNEQLLEQEAQLRATLSSSDQKSLEFFESLRLTLIKNKSTYSKAFEVMPLESSINIKDMTKSTVSGLAGAFFLMISVLLCQRFWANIKGVNGARVGA